MFKYGSSAGGSSSTGPTPAKNSMNCSIFQDPSTAAPWTPPQNAGGDMLWAWSASWPLPSSYTKPGVCRIVSPVSLLTPSLPPAVMQHFFPFLKYDLTAWLTGSFTGSTLAITGSFLEPGGTGSQLTWGNCWALLTASSLLPKLSHVILIHALKQGY